MPGLLKARPRPGPLPGVQLLTSPNSDVVQGIGLAGLILGVMVGGAVVGLTLSLVGC